MIGRDGFAGATVGTITREAGASLGLLELPLRVQGRGRRRGLRGRRARGSRRAGGDLAPLRGPGGAARPPTWTSPSGRTPRAGGCGSTRGASPSTRRWCATRSGASTSAGARCSPRCSRTACARGAGTCADPQDTAARLVAVIDGIGLHTTVHGEDVPPERATRVGAPAGRARARRRRCPAPPPPVVAPVAARVHATRIAIRARDLDAHGHVDPAVLFTFLEEARAAWLGARVPDAVVTPRRGRLPPAAGPRPGDRDVHAGRGRPRELPHARDGRDATRASGSRPRRRSRCRAAR